MLKIAGARGRVFRCVTSSLPVPNRRHFRQNRQCRLRRLPAPEIEADGPVQAPELGIGDAGLAQPLATRGLGLP
jgi:hypothetical protein